MLPEVFSLKLSPEQIAGHLLSAAGRDEPAGLVVTDAFVCKAEHHLSALQHGHLYYRISTPG